MTTATSSPPGELSRSCHRRCVYCGAQLERDGRRRDPPTCDDHKQLPWRDSSYRAAAAAAAAARRLRYDPTSPTVPGPRR